VQGFTRNTEAHPTLPTGRSGSKNPIPDYVKIFGQVFSEEGFAKLPNWKPWDHAIELVPGAQLKGCKVYPISVTEQSELDHYPIERQVSKNTYHLQLPNPMCHLHPVFNVVRQPKLPPPLELVEGEEEYLVEEILNSKMFRSRLRFLIRWEGYGVEHNTWEYASDVHAPKCLAEFYRKHLAAPRQIRAATFSSIPFRSVPTCFESKQS
jgi:hypothetical protein